MKIIYIELGLKGDMVINMLKFVIVELGVIVCVFLFINEGEIIEIDICDGLYVGCVKV